MQFIDLTLPIEGNISEPEPVRIETIHHREGAFLLTKNSGLHADDFPEGLGLSLERISMTSHSGTHVDSPLHYGPFVGDQKARSIDEMPLNWFFGPGLVLDCRSADLKPISLEDLKKAIFTQQLSIEAGDIILICTGADLLWGKPSYFTTFRGMTLEATEWLLDLGVKVIGIDSFGFDPPFHQMIHQYLETKNPNVLWPCHMLGRRREYCQIERLAYLDRLPFHKKFSISCFPIKLKKCGAAPSRVIAIINEVNHV